MEQYVRLSRVAGRSGNSFISPDLQREQGAAWASSRGVEVAAVHEDLDQSAGKLSVLAWMRAWSASEQDKRIA